MNNKNDFLSHYAPYKGLFTADIVCSVLAAVLALLLPVCVRYITINVLNSDNADIYEIIKAGIIMFVIIIAQTGFSVFYDYKGHDMGAKIERDMRGKLFEKYQTLPFSFFDNQKTGQLMSRLTNDLLNLAELYHHLPENIAVYLTQFLGAFVILLYINWKLTLIIFMFLPIMAVYSFIFYRKLEKAYKENRENIAEVNSRAEENLSGIRIVKSFAAEILETKMFNRENERFYKGRSGIYKHEALYYTVIECFFTPLITVAIIVAGGIWIAEGSLMPADLLIFIMYAAYLTAPVPKLAFMVQQYQEGMAGYRRFYEIMQLAPGIKDSDNAYDINIKEGGITLNNVTFRYTEGSEFILNGINLDIKPGETAAIIGPSGIGKTTLCSLIPRFYEVSSGEVKIDGINICDVTQASLRRQIGIVRQDSFLFAGTVLENILYGNPERDREAAIKAAKLANAHSFITKLPNGYDTNIGQRGVKLSGGQQQRISIARVFLKNPPILIFDEATSALDYESEKAVLEGIHALSKDRTTIIIAHRLSTIRNADRIIRLSSEGLTEQNLESL